MGAALNGLEEKLWSGITQAGALSELSNSFLWLLGDSEEKLARIVKQPSIVFDKVGFDYITPPVTENENRDQDEKLIEHLRAQIIQLESHSKNLEDKVNIMSTSIGWKFLNGVRRLLRKTTI